MAEENVKVQFDTPVTEEIREAEANKEANNTAEAKEEKAVYHCDYNKGETPTKKSDIDMKYIIDYCAGHRKYDWFVNAVDAAGGMKTKGYAFKVKSEFIKKFYPALNVKQANKTSIQSVYEDFKAKANFKSSNNK